MPPSAQAHRLLHPDDGLGLFPAKSLQIEMLYELGQWRLPRFLPVIGAFWGSTQARGAICTGACETWCRFRSSQRSLSPGWY